MRTLSSNFNGFGAFDRNEFFGRTGGRWHIRGFLEIDRSEELEEVSRDLKPALDVRRRSIAEDEAEVDGHGRKMGEWCSESLESSSKVTWNVEVLLRGRCNGVLMMGSSFSFSNTDIDVNGSKRVSDSLR